MSGTMKQFIKSSMLVLTGALLLLACQKELSLEGNGLKGNAQGTLTDVSGACKDAIVKGDYIVDQALTDSNYVVLNVNFTVQGKYLISTDTVNGMWFLDSGYALTTGATTVKVKGHGKPILPVISDFVVNMNTSYCSFSVVASATGATGTSNDYFPNTTGSNWTYQYLPAMGTISEFTATVTNNRIFQDGKVFTEFSTDPLNEPFYFSKDNAGNYYAFSTVDFDYLFLFDSIPSNFITYPFLKEGAAIGETWETAEYGKVKLGVEVGVTKAKFTMVNKTLPYTISGTTYNNVIQIKREIYFKPDGGTSFRLVLEGNSYYAKNIGLIDQVIPLSSSSSQATTLKRSQVF
jgi:hypothetical protein